MEPKDLKWQMSIPCCVLGGVPWSLLFVTFLSLLTFIFLSQWLLNLCVNKNPYWWVGGSLRICISSQAGGGGSGWLMQLVWPSQCENLCSPWICSAGHDDSTWWWRISPVTVPICVSSILFKEIQVRIKFGIKNQKEKASTWLREAASFGTHCFQPQISYYKIP